MSLGVCTCAATLTLPGNAAVERTSRGRVGGLLLGDRLVVRNEPGAADEQHRGARRDAPITVVHSPCGIDRLTLSRAVTVLRPVP